MGKIVRYEFIGNQIAVRLQELGLLIAALFLPRLLLALIPFMIVYLLLTIVKIEEEMEHPNEVIAGFKEGRFRS